MPDPRARRLLVYGGDWNTRDGTCVRDYVHTEDLASAHMECVVALRRGDRRVYNLGSGKGVTVLEVIRACEQVVGEPIAYEVVPENDLNGAGLLYFARYVAITNYAERLFLLRQLERPFSAPLSRFLSCQRRRTYYFANADPGDFVQVHCSAALVDEDRPARERDPLRSTMARFVFRFELYRQSDGVLMACSAVTKCLTIPNRMKALQAEARRLLRSATGG